MDTLTLKQQNYILKLDNTRTSESLKNLTKKDASILIAKLVKATKHNTKAHKTQAPKETITKFEHGFNVGDILYSSWGYEQTNLNFFKVIKATEKSIRIVEVSMKKANEEGVSGMSRYIAFDTKTAEPLERSIFIEDQEKGDLKRVGSYEYQGKKTYYVNVGRGRYGLYHYNGKKLYESWYA